MSDHRPSQSRLFPDPPPDLSPGPAVVIPARSFQGAKSRLAPELPASARQRLAEAMLGDVLDAVMPYGWPVTVVTCDPRVAARALAAGAGVVRDHGSGQSAAAAAGLAAVRGFGASHVLLLAADLPLLDAPAFAWMADEMRQLSARAAGLVPAVGRGATNAIWLPAWADFHFQFGDDSLPRHRQEAMRLGLTPVEVRCAPVEADLDAPEDLRIVLPLLPSARTWDVLAHTATPAASGRHRVSSNLAGRSLRPA